MRSTKGLAFRTGSNDDSYRFNPSLSGNEARARQASHIPRTNGAYVIAIALREVTPADDRILSERTPSPIPRHRPRG
jgi:hypothetical protein